MVSPVIVVTALVGTDDSERRQDSESHNDYYLRNWISNNYIRDSHPVWNILDDVPITASPNIPTPTPVPSLPSPAALPYVKSPAPSSTEGIICSFTWAQGCDYWIAVAMCESTF